MLQIYAILLTVFAAFGGFMFGYDIGIINGVKDMDGFRTEMNLTLVSKINGSAQCAGEDEKENSILGLIVSLFSVGCFIGALLSGGLSDWIGRKYAIVVGGGVFLLGGAVQSASLNLWMILVGRMVAGIGVGVLSMVVPVYNAEISPKNLRGRLVALNQLFITAGIMVSFLVNLGASHASFGWRISLGIQCLLAFILITGMVFLPETPRWLVKKGKIERAQNVLTNVRQGSTYGEIKEEISEIERTLQDTRSFSDIMKALLKWKVLERIIIGMMLQMFQQLTGMNVIMYYSTQIFCSIHVNGYIATAVVGMANFLTTLLTILLVDKVGRKTLLLTGAMGMFLSILLAGLLIQLFDVDKGENQAVGYVVALLILSFVFCFAYSWGPVAWVVTSEIFPLSVRGLAVSITTSANWIGNFIVAMVTPILLGTEFLQTPGTFYIYSGFLLIAFFFVLLSLPETKGESLERIDLLFDKPWLERINLLYYLKCGCPWRCGRGEGYDIEETSPEKGGLFSKEERDMLISSDEQSSETDIDSSYAEKNR